ncbi:MAG: pyridoxal phosphate-dependent aminotransferase [Candidatus Cloacimonetes bacterium]|nr:pyridoxal phosphate-dependent aminotransferase [Candidatus Cloacimonadota bacterium]MBS3767027.1 pyridoxal phosphate-dependent aminotransferase [Candidatus Cloacimonadota bacterium]
MDISKRANTIQASPLRKLMPFADKAKEEGKKIYHLNIGQPDIKTPDAILNEYRNFAEEVLAYGPSQGLKLYRENLVNYYKRHGIEVNPDEIVVTTAGSEALIFAMMVTCDPGDEIIIPEPFYTNYNGFSTIADVKIVPLTTYAEEGFDLPDKKTIEAKITDKTKAILLCNPGNPTGKVYTPEEMKRVAELALEYDLFVISDEVYREFVYDDLSHTSIMDMEELQERAVMVDSISKRYSACGARIGCLISKNSDLIAATIKFAQARLCPPTIDQLAANAAIDIEQEYFVDVLQEYKNRREIVFNALQKIDDVVCIKPKGAFYVIAKLPIDNAENFVKWMLTDFDIDGETVMFAPAEGFYATPAMGRDEVRLAYVLNTESLKKAMQIFTEGLITYKKLKKEYND